MTENNEDKKEYQVLEFFGIPIKVKSKGVAEVLTMDAKDALKTDIKEIKDKIGTKELEEDEVPEEIDLVDEEPAEENEFWRDIVDNARFAEVVSYIGKNLGFLCEEEYVWGNKSFEKLAIFPIGKVFEVAELRLAFDSFQKFMRDNNILSGLIITADEKIGMRAEKALYAHGKAWPLRCVYYEDLVKINKMKDSHQITQKLLMTLLSYHHTNNVRVLLTLITNPASINTL